eukprot:c38754_g1_i1.p1 GENE.c38754_g1_i1~~c38754_g1_i1.p1  ORF type:complete len:371 (-),score=89.06 c38754_g1_i1:947-2059(-)
MGGHFHPSGRMRVLILGGLGFVGRNLVKYLVDNNLAEFIRVVDKAIPVTAHIAPIHQAAFDSGIVHVMQGDLSREATMTRAFTTEDGSKFNVVVNLAAESQHGQEDAVYTKNILEVARQAGKVALAHGVDKFIEVSHAGVYDSDNHVSNENAKIDPWTIMYRFKFQAEEHLRGLGLPLVVLRPAIIYGPGDLTGLSPRMICARIYQHENKKMNFLWGAGLRINTVHVDDVCRAIWHAATVLPAGSTFNVADKSDTTQGTFNEFLKEMFGIETGFFNALTNTAFKSFPKRGTQEINSDHMDTWGEICKGANIERTPLTPYLAMELLFNKNMAVDGSALEAAGFEYSRPQMTRELLEAQLDLFKSQGLFPAN